MYFFLGSSAEDSSCRSPSKRLLQRSFGFDGKKRLFFVFLNYKRHRRQWRCRVAEPSEINMRFCKNFSGSRDIHRRERQGQKSRHQLQNVSETGKRKQSMSVISQERVIILV